MKFILILLLTISSTLASVNGPCSGRDGICIDSSKCSSYGGTTYSGKCPKDANNIKCCDSLSCSANGKTGKCVFSSQCKGESVGGKCPGGSDFKCCLGSTSGGGGGGGGGGSGSGSGSGSTSTKLYYGPCSGGGGACINVDRVSCETSTVSGKCSGGSNIKCCVAGSKPSWYVDQRNYKKPICKIDGENKSVSNAGCGMASLAMAIEVTLRKKISPEVLFQEGYDKKLYHGRGFTHEAISSIGKNHGVQVSWTEYASDAYSALAAGKCVIYHVGHESKYNFTSQGHYIFLKGAKVQNGIQKVYVFDPNGSNNYINVLFPLKSAHQGIELARRTTQTEYFGIVSKA